MTSQDFLRQALDNLRQAQQARKMEVDDLRKQVNDRDQDYKAKIQDLKQRESSSLNDAANATDDSTRFAKEREAQMAKSEESQANSNFAQLKRDLDAAISTKQRSLDDLNRLAQDVERNMMQP